MRRLSLVIALLVPTPGWCEVPVVNLPHGLREENWVSTDDEGSCVFATIVMAFRWQQEYQLADYYRRTYSGGEYADDSWNYGSNLARKFDADGIRYAYTVDGDEGFLEWAIGTRRGAGVTVRGGRHMVLLVHLDDKWAGLLDNNDIDEVRWVDRSRFLAEWHNSNGWAVTPVYTPAPPLPKGKDQ